MRPVEDRSNRDAWRRRFSDFRKHSGMQLTFRPNPVSCLREAVPLPQGPGAS